MRGAAGLQPASCAVGAAFACAPINRLVGFLLVLLLLLLVLDFVLRFPGPRLSLQLLPSRRLLLFLVLLSGLALASPTAPIIVVQLTAIRGLPDKTKECCSDF